MSYITAQSIENWTRGAYLYYEFGGMKYRASPTVLDGRISPGYGKTGRMAGTGQGGRFSLSGRYSAIENGIHTYIMSMTDNLFSRPLGPEAERARLHATF